MKNYIHDGDALTVTAPADVLSGAGVLVGFMFGVAAGDALTGADVTIVRKGVFKLAKTSAQAWAQGEAIYWDDAAKECTTVDTENTLIGWAVQAAADPSATGLVVI